MSTKLEAEILQVLGTAEKSLTMTEVSERIYARRVQEKTKKHGPLLWPRLFLTPSSGNLAPVLHWLVERKAITIARDLDDGPDKPRWRYAIEPPAVTQT